MTRKNAARVRTLLASAALLALATPGPAAHAGCDRATFRIAVDVGHSRQSPGAYSARGRPEFEFNLSLAGDVAAALKKSGFVNAEVMVSEGRGRMALARRAARADRAGVGLFLSIHHDSVQDVYLEKWIWQGRTLRFSDRYKGYSLFVSGENRQFGESLRMARLLGAALRERGLTYTTHHAEKIKGENRELIDAAVGVYRFDQLVVLKGARAPAVLMEAGVIVNRAEEEALAAPVRRRQIAEAAAEAAGAFCAGA